MADVQQLISLQGQGLSAAEIGRLVGLTRSAVLGAIWRHKNPGKVKKYRLEYEEYGARRDRVTAAQRMDRDAEAYLRRLDRAREYARVKREKTRQASPEGAL